jgi:hypothetical protein
VFRLPGGGSEVFDFTNIGKLLIVIGLLTAGIGVVAIVLIISFGLFLMLLNFENLWAE